LILIVYIFTFFILAVILVLLSSLLVKNRVNVKVAGDKIYIQIFSGLLGCIRVSASGSLPVLQWKLGLFSDKYSMVLPRVSPETGLYHGQVEIRPLRKEHKIPDIPALLKVMEIIQFNIYIDTGVFILNSFLFPFASAINQYTLCQLIINYEGKQEAHLQIRFVPVRLLWLYWRSAHIRRY